VRRVGVNWGKYGVLVSICAEDGSVVVSHGGIESGQGINTKVKLLHEMLSPLMLYQTTVEKVTNLNSKQIHS